MAENSKIEWTTHTFNPWTGCAKVSPGCRFCYAEGNRARFGHGDEWGVNAVRRVTSDANWRKPLRWDRDAAAAGRRDRVFCASLADVFEDRPDLVEPRTRLFQLIQQTPNLDWLLLTKRTANMARMLPWTLGQGLAGEVNNVGGDDRPWPNVWLGTTVEDQQRADERIPILLDIPATVRFLSCEPLVGPVTLPTCGTSPSCSGCPGGRTDCWLLPDWVICGGESGGRHARPMQQEWARSLRDQCQAAGVAFHFKQWGSWAPFGQIPDDLSRDWDAAHGAPHPPDDEIRFWGSSGKSAGRLLDGRTWDELPGVAHG